MPTFIRAPFPSKKKKNNKPILDFVCQILLVGDPNTGLKSLMRRYVEGFFAAENSMSSLHPKFASKKFVYHEMVIANLVWNATVQQQNKPPYNDVDVIILSFDLSNLHSFNKLDPYLKDIDKRKKPILVVGTKSDKEKLVSSPLIEKFIRKLKLNYNFQGYFETSAKEGINVNKIFEAATRAYLFDQAESPKKPLIKALQKYIDRIEKYHSNTGTPDFGHGFWFFTQSRMANRKANYLLAKSLLKDLYTREDCSIAEIFCNLDEHRKVIIATESIWDMRNFVNRGMNSRELQRVFDKVEKDISIKTNSANKMPT